MCLVIVNVDGRHIPRSYIRSAHSRNDDSFGIMWAGPDGKLKISKGLLKYDAIVNLFERMEAEGNPYVAHFRMATHGATDWDNSHPFLITDKEYGGVGMVHNGVFSGFSEYGGYGWGRREGKSDTANFVDRIQDHIEQGDMATSDLFVKEAPSLRLFYDSEIGTYNKLAFMNGLGEINIVNEKQGEWIGGAWYSNSYSIGQVDKYHFVHKHTEALHDLPKLENIIEEANIMLFEGTDDEDEEDDDDRFSVFGMGEEEDAISAAFDSLDKDELDDEVVMHPLALANGYKDRENVFEFEGQEYDLTTEVEKLYFASKESDESEDTQPISRQAVREALAKEIQNTVGQVDNEVSEWEQWVREYNGVYKQTQAKESTSTALATTPKSYGTSTNATHASGYYGTFGKYSHGRPYSSYTPQKSWEDEIVEAFLAP